MLTTPVLNLVDLMSSSSEGAPQERKTSRLLAKNQKRSTSFLNDPGQLQFCERHLMCSQKKYLMPCLVFQRGCGQRCWLQPLWVWQPWCWQMHGSSVNSSTPALSTSPSQTPAWLSSTSRWSSRSFLSPSSLTSSFLQSLVLVILTGKLMRKLFFGQLRAAEFEHLMERSWYAVTETCLAFTVFKWV